MAWDEEWFILIPSHNLFIEDGLSTYIVKFIVQTTSITHGFSVLIPSP